MTVNKLVLPCSMGSYLVNVATYIIQPDGNGALPELTDELLTRGKVNTGGRPRSQPSIKHRPPAHQPGIEKP